MILASNFMDTEPLLFWLMHEGLAMIDDGHKDGKRRYWFPRVSRISSLTGIDSL